jgi:hypothetical protein
MPWLVCFVEGNGERLEGNTRNKLHCGARWVDVEG